MFKDLYKQKGVGEVEERQESRRRELLVEQKLKRNEFQDEHRTNLLETSREGQKAAKKPHRMFKDIYGEELGLQMSEWMRELPENLNDWLLVPCPVGQRCLVVAHGGRTEMFNKSGRRVFTFKSVLPGAERNSRNNTTILDCVYARETDQFFVLDVLFFGCQEFINCDAHCRSFWLISKFEEHPHLSKRSVRNEKPILLLRQYDFEYAEQVAEAFQLFPLWPKNNPQLDGFLFYHKEASYSCNATTPLVVWLFPFMVSDMLNMEVNSNYIRPVDYENPLQFMDLFDMRLAKKHSKSKKNKNQTADSTMEFDEDSTTMESSTLENLLESERMLELEGTID